MAIELKGMTTSSPRGAATAMTEKLHDALEADLDAGDPKARNLVQSTRAELNAARECMGRHLFID
jgi:hypothetical protein